MYLDSLDSAGQPLKDPLDVAALLHGDDAELVLLPEPDDEAAVRGLVAAPPARPVGRDARRTGRSDP